MTIDREDLAKRGFSPEQISALADHCNKTGASTELEGKAKKVTRKTKGDDK